tara:strand:- start:3894 stop:4589 length:696 start_codon:yes stop_codon:yes gene_type:complete
MKLNFEGKVILVTGSSRGIGKQIYEDFKSLGGEVIGLSSKDCDFSNPEEVQHRFSQRTLGIDWNKIDVLVNNAGINKIATFENISYEDYTDIMNVNLHAPFLISQEISKIMKKNKYGRIVNISSIWGTKTKERRAAYTTSKSAINGLTKTMSVELARYNILVNTVSPGFTMTEMTEKILTKAEKLALMSQVPVRRFATVSDISKAVMFLASDLNTYITGQDLKVDGGFSNV